MKKDTEQERLYPKHVAIIMDGNGRWAENRSLPRTQGHIEGMRRVEELVDYACETDLEVLTLYTFSTENWNRPESEVATLMNMLTTVLNRKIEKMKANNIRFQTIGSPDRIPDPLLAAMEKMSSSTENNTGLIMNLAFNYGSRVEILNGVKKIAQEVLAKKLEVDDINENTIDDSLYTKDLPDPDLLIRTSGEKRISNFLLWQLSYAEFYFTETLWPDFNIEEFQKAIDDFQHRDRRFGHVTTKR